MIKIKADPEDEMSIDIADAIETAIRENRGTVLEYDFAKGDESSFVRITVQPITKAQFESETLE